MGLFKRFFGKEFKYEIQNMKEEEAYNWADPLTTGWEYTCNLFLTTPKICLINDGSISQGIKKPELYGEPNKFGADGEPSGKYGSWTRRMGYEEAFDQFENISEDIIYSRPSDIGKIPRKSKLEKDLKNFLIEFRSIVESYIEIEEKILRIKNELANKSQAFSYIYKKLIKEKEFPDSFFQKELSMMNGVNDEISKILWEAGYLSPKQVLKATEKELLEFSDLNINQIRKIIL